MLTAPYRTSVFAAVLQTPFTWPRLALTCTNSPSCQRLSSHLFSQNSHLFPLTQQNASAKLTLSSACQGMMYNIEGPEPVSCRWEKLVGINWPSLLNAWLTWCCTCKHWTVTSLVKFPLLPLAVYVCLLFVALSLSVCPSVCIIREKDCWWFFGSQATLRLLTLTLHFCETICYHLCWSQ